MCFLPSCCLSQHTRTTQHIDGCHVISDGWCLLNPSVSVRPKACMVRADPLEQSTANVHEMWALVCVRLSSGLQQHGGRIAVGVESVLLRPFPSCGCPPFLCG